MRKVTAQLVGYFLARKAGSAGNSHSDGDAMYLHGNKIAEFRDDRLWITNAGWSTNTTKERLNGLPGVHVQQKNFAWYLNDKPWDGSWQAVGSN